MSPFRYVPSGRFPAVALLWTAGSAPLVVLLAWVYAWLISNVPMVVVAVFSLFGFSLGISVLTMLVARFGKVRHPGWMGRIGILMGLVGWYAQWAAWVTLEGGAGAPGYPALLLGHPQAVLDAALAVSNHQLREIAGVRLDGVLLKAIWAIELLALTVVPRILARSAAADPFCEAGNRWPTSLAVPGKYAVLDDAAVQALEQDPAQLLSLLSPCPGADPVRYASVTLYRCADAPIVSVSHVQVARSKDKEKLTTETVIEFLRLPGVDADQLIEHAHAVAANAPQQAAEPDDPPELVAAIAHLQAERFEQALAAASAHVNAPRRGLQVDALRLCALATARLERWDQSLAYWKALFDHEPTPGNALQLGSTGIMAGDVEFGQAWIARARELNKTSPEMPDLQMLTNCITALTRAGHMAQALPYLEQLRSVYMGLGITDSTFLYLRQVPFLGVFLEHSLPVIQAVLDGEEGRNWYAAMLPHLDPHGNDSVNAWLAAHFAASTTSA